MISVTIRRLSAISALAVMSVGAYAFNIDLVSVGDLFSVDNFSLTYSLNENVVFQNGGAPLSVLNVVNQDNFSNTGQGTYSNGGDSLTLQYTFSSNFEDAFSSTQSLSGTWVYVSGTGSYAGLSGSGIMNIAIDYNHPVGDGFQSSTQTFGKLEAVPEPASMAILGLGLLGVARRRRNRR